MKKLMLVFMGFIVIFPMFARNFEYTYEGQTLTYTVISEEDRTCMTKEGDGWSPGNNVSGNLIVPDVVLDGDTEYSVTEIGSFAFVECKGLVSVTI
ncbi:MAG: hypothetical protein K2K37_10240, partial [Muribaculaceae bacterium]|nr:hypothetical protein [Muribaculaceae bacterium]